MKAAFERISQQLYSLAPEEFVGARDQEVARARKAKQTDLAKQLKGLAKPTVAAWLLNQMCRRRPQLVTQLEQLGKRMRKAQQSLDGAALRELANERRKFLQTWGEQSAEVAEELGHPVTEAIEREVTQTVMAALNDERASQALKTGQLTRSLDASSLGDLESIQLKPRRATPKGEADSRRRKLVKQLAQAQAARDKVEARVEKLRSQLAEAERELMEAESSVSAVQAELEDV